MSSRKRPTDMQRIASAFHFTKKDLMLNRQRRLSDSQRKRNWRRFWTALILLIVIFGLGGVFLGFFMWGTAPEGTFTFLPSKSVFIEEGADYEQLFLFAQIFAVLFVVIFIVSIIGIIGLALNIRRGEVFVYRGMIRVRQGYDDNRLQLLDDGRGFDISDSQYNVLNPLADQRAFAVYYLKNREGILSMEPIS